MTRRALPWILTLFLLPTAAATDAQRISTPVFTKMLIEYLGAEPVECSAAVARLDGGERAKCASLDLEWRAIKKKTRSFLTRHVSQEEAGGAWDHDKEFRSRYVSWTEEPLRLLVDLDRQWLAVLPDHPCFEAAFLESLDLVDARDGVQAPERVHAVHPYYPDEAMQLKSGGSVVLEAIVRKDGSVGETCVIRSSRPGVGFEEAAIDSVSQWRYKPTLRDGVPVNVWITVTTSWSIP